MKTHIDIEKMYIHTFISKIKELKNLKYPSKHSTCFLRGKRHVSATTLNPRVTHVSQIHVVLYSTINRRNVSEIPFI